MPDRSHRSRLRAFVNKLAFVVFFVFGVIAFAELTQSPRSNSSPSDPGPRGGSTSIGAIQQLTANEFAVFNAGKAAFQEIDSVSGTLTGGSGLGPRFNLDSCSGCHAFPDIGGSSPQVNPQIALATRYGARNTIPSFLSAQGPVREARFVRGPSGAPDGGVHGLFVISGRSDADGCTISQPDFEGAVSANNVVFRIPTPVFGAGLIEAIDDTAILANIGAGASQKAALGIGGHANRNANDGTMTRFGWKAQNKSLTIFAGEAYNVEQGVTNDIFPNERESAEGCRYNATPEDHIDLNAAGLTGVSSDVLKFVFFMRFLAPPGRGPSTSSTSNGQALFNSVGCALCHTPSMTTVSNVTAALSNKPVNLFSDLLVHNMGAGLADGIAQGAATGNEFRTAPLWGLGQRLFFLHDGRTNDLTVAIGAHASAGSEANGVMANYNSLTLPQKQDLVNFLRSL
jgi:CxxC motif-containing protein (DUF1111 family)